MLKQLISIFSICFLTGLYSFGQSSFEIIINNDKNEYLICGKKDYSGSFVLTGTSQEYINKIREKQYSALIVKVDTLGQYITSTLQFSDTNCSLLNVIVTADSNYLFTGYIREIDADSNQLWLYKTDRLLNKIWEKRFRIPLDSGYTRCRFTSYGTEDNQGNLVLAAMASYLQSNQDDMVLIKVNQQGEVLLSKQFHYEFTQAIVDLLTVPNSSDIILISNHISIYGYQTRFIRMDSALNVKSILPVDSSMYMYEIIGTVDYWINDSLFMYCGHYSGVEGRAQNDEISVSLINDSCVVQKEVILGRPDTLDYPAYTNCMSYLNDTSVFIGGFVNALSFFPETPNVLDVYRLDTQLNVLGRTSFSNDAFYNLYGIIAANDGGCILYGGRYGPENNLENDIFVVKFSPNDFTVSINEFSKIDSEFGVVVFPNPTRGILHINLPPAIFLEKKDVRIYNSQGKIVRTRTSQSSKQIQIDCRSLPSGIYLYAIFVGNKKMKQGKFVKE